MPATNRTVAGEVSLRAVVLLMPGKTRDGNAFQRQLRIIVSGTAPPPVDRPPASPQAYHVVCDGASSAALSRRPIACCRWGTASVSFLNSNCLVNRAVDRRGRSQVRGGSGEPECSGEGPVAGARGVHRGGVELNRPVEGGDRFDVAVLRQQRLAEAEVRLRLVGGDTQPVLQKRNTFGGAVGAGEAGADLDHGQSMVRVDLDLAGKCRPGLVEPPKMAKRDTQGVVEVGVIGDEPLRFLQRLQCFVTEFRFG